MGQNEFDLAEWLVYEKEIILADINPRVKKFISNYNDRTNPFKETKYISDLRDIVKNQILQRTLILKGLEWNVEKIYLLFEEESVKMVIDRHYMREYLYD